MKNNRIALSVSLALALAGASSSAFAGIQVYGSYELGRLDSSNDADTLVPFAYDADVAGNPVKYVGHGDGMNHNMRLGMKFSVPAFVEFGTGRGEFADQAQFGTDSLGGACNVAPTLGLIDDCFNQANISQRVEMRNMELIGGWRFDIAGKTHISPYAGVRKVKVNDTRFVDYNYRDGFINTIQDESYFSEQGWVAGVRFVQDFAQFYLSAELQYARASGDRSRNIVDTESDTSPGGGGSELGSIEKAFPVTQTLTSNVVENITVRQRMGRIGIGRRFDFGGLPSNISLGYQVNKADGFDTRSTQDNAYTPGQLGSRDVELDRKGFFLRFEVNN